MKLHNIIKKALTYITYPGCWYYNPLVIDKPHRLRSYYIFEHGIRDNSRESVLGNNIYESVNRILRSDMPSVNF